MDYYEFFWSQVLVTREAIRENHWQIASLVTKNPHPRQAIYRYLSISFEDKIDLLPVNIYILIGWLKITYIIWDEP